VAISMVDHLTPATNRLLALALLFAVLAFLVWSWRHPRTLGKNRWRVQLPSGPLVLWQILIGLLDLTSAALAMYVLIPSGLDIGLFRLMAVFIAATLLGFASHAPAGLGAFDATILIGLGSEDREQMLATLLMFRFLYHFLPLCAALLLFGAVEGWRGLRVNARSNERAASSDRRVQFQPDHAGDDQGEADDPDRIGGFAVEIHADDDTADCADTGPDRIRRAERQRP